VDETKKFLSSVMQALNWYYRRLIAMPPAEIAWRTKSSLRDYTDRLIVSQRQRIRKSSAILNGGSKYEGSDFRVSDMAIGDGARLKTNDEIKKHWYNSLIVRAERIAEHRLDFYDLKDKYLGSPIVWNQDHKRKQQTPMVFSPSLDYRDVKKAGDCKFVWEPNRHHQFVVLGRAYRMSGDIQFADAVAEQLDSWLRQNPYGLGMNWRSSLELGIRLINWVWVSDLIRESNAIRDDLYLRLMDSISRHIWEIDRKYSRGTSVGNHLIGEAAGVFVATSYFRNLNYAPLWRDKSWKILNQEIINQTYPDGGSWELSIGYHLFVLQFFVVAGIVARATGRDFPEAYWSRLEKMFEFIVTLSQGGDNLPAFGDGDDGYVLDLGSNPHNVKEWLAVGAALFGRSDFKTVAGDYSEPAEWLLGKPGKQKYDAIQELQDKTITSRAFKHSGYYLLQHGELDSQDRISVVFDCGPLGLKPLAGHGHADALSFTLRAFGRDVLVDPGTYDYFSYPKWREYFRSTRAHNTIVVDGRDQSEMLGLFLWGKRAMAHCINWDPTNAGGRVVGEHDGYTHLKDPVTHRRSIDLDGRDRTLIIRDDIIAHARHKIDIYFHLADYCMVNPAGGHCYLVDVGPGTIEIELDKCLRIESFNGSEDPICGWISRGYHQKNASTTLVGSCTCEGSTSLVCRINIGALKQGFK